MNSLNEYKVIFSPTGSSVAASLIAVANKSLSQEQVKKKLITELLSNYCDDNHFTFDNTSVVNAIDNSSCTLVGELKTTEPLYDDVADYTFLLLHKTEDWRLK